MDKNADKQEGAPQEAGPDIHGYKHIFLSEAKWATPSAGWQWVGGWAIVIFACLACTLLTVLADRGWDGFLTLLGWK